MKQFMMSLAVGVFGLVLCGPLQADPHSTNGKGGGAGPATSHGVMPSTRKPDRRSPVYPSGTSMTGKPDKPSPVIHGETTMHPHPASQIHPGRYAKKFSHGYYYAGKDHHHWSGRKWSNRYGCYLHYDEGLRCNYYWCRPDRCYYPVSYCPYNRYSWPSDSDEDEDGEESNDDCCDR